MHSLKADYDALCATVDTWTRCNTEALVIALRRATGSLIPLTTRGLEYCNVLFHLVRLTGLRMEERPQEDYSQQCG